MIEWRLKPEGRFIETPLYTSEI